MAPLVTVVVPCLNYAHFLDECIESLRQQSYKHWECIIVDDGSTDETPDVASRLTGQDSRIRYVRQENAGPNAARNAGIRRGTGNFVQLLDADDLLDQEKLRVQVHYLAQNRDVDIVVGQSAYFDSTATRLRAWRRGGASGLTTPIGSSSADTLRKLVDGNICVIHAALVRRQVFDTVGYLDESLRGFEDWEFWLRCALAGERFAFLSTTRDRALVREHRANTSASRLLMITTGIAVRERVHSRLDTDLQRENGRCLSRLRFKLAVEHMRRGRIWEGCRLFHMAWKRQSGRISALTELVGLVPGVLHAAQFGRRLYTRWLSSGNRE